DEVEEETLPEGDPPDERVVRRLWSEWTAVVEGTLTDPNRTRSASEATYGEAHRALVQGCRGLARTADSTLRPMFQRLAGLVEPWLTPQTLAATDRPTLRALLLSCRQAERALGWHGPGGFGRWAVVGLALVLSAIAGVWLSRFKLEESGARSLLQT